MRFYFNNSEIDSLEHLFERMKDNEQFDVLLEKDDANWIQYFSEDSVISVAWKQKGVLKYANIKNSSLQKSITEYCNNYNSFKLNGIRKKSDSEPVGKILRNLFINFLVVLFLFSLSVIYICSRNKCNIPIVKQVADYYLDLSRPGCTIILPAFLFANFIFLIIYLIKFLVMKIKDRKKS